MDDRIKEYLCEIGRRGGMRGGLASTPAKKEAAKLREQRKRDAKIEEADRRLYDRSLDQKYISENS